MSETRNAQDGPPMTVADLIATRIPSPGDSTVYDGVRITHWGRRSAPADPYERCIHCLAVIPDHLPDCCRKDTRG